MAATRHLVSPFLRAPRRLLILDFEATCGPTLPQREMEIIEFPTLVYDVEQKKVTATFHEYVRPTRHPILTEFCTNLTGITQDIVDKADTFSAVWSRFREFLRLQGAFEDPDVNVFLTCGHWDLKTMLPQQLEQEKAGDPSLSTEPAALFSRWINIKKSFETQYSSNSGGMVSMLHKLKIKLEGRHHSGIDDCKNILKIVERMREDGWKPKDDRFFTNA